jgi:TetR/AcrR family transcriptional regulator
VATICSILDAAERLFLGRGYSATTMEDLSATADVAVGSICAHFGGKEGVYSALVDRALALDRRYSAEKAPGPAARIAERISAEVARMAGLLGEAAEEGAIRPVDPEPMARFMWAAWDGVIAAHLGPANVGISDAEFERMLNQARESLIRGLLPYRE